MCGESVLRLWYVQSEFLPFRPVEWSLAAVTLEASVCWCNKCKESSVTTQPSVCGDAMHLWERCKKEWFTRVSHYSVNPEISTLTSHKICTHFCDKQDFRNFYRFDKTDLHIQIKKFINMKCAYPVNRKCNTHYWTAISSFSFAFRFVSKGEWHPLQIRVKKVCTCCVQLNTRQDKHWALLAYVILRSSNCLSLSPI